jgi:hypothetical protein
MKVRRFGAKMESRQHADSTSERSPKLMARLVLLLSWCMERGHRTTILTALCLD